MNGYIIQADGVTVPLYIVDKVLMPVVTELTMPAPPQPGGVRQLGQQNVKMPVPMALSAYYCFECPNGKMEEIYRDPAAKEEMLKVTVDLSQPHFITPDRIGSIVLIPGKDIFSIRFINRAEIEWDELV